MLNKLEQELSNLSNVHSELAVYDAITEYPRIPTSLGMARLILLTGEPSQRKAVKFFEQLSGATLKIFLPEFQYPITTSDSRLLVINEFAPDDSSIAVRSVGANQNIYTGNKQILEEAEVFFRNQGMTDREGHGKPAALEEQANTIVRLLDENLICARMSAFSVVIHKTNNEHTPYRVELKLRDLSQLTPQIGALKGRPIAGDSCFWGLINTALWFHKKEIN